MSKKNHNKNQADYPFGNGSQHHSSANDQAEFEAFQKEAIRQNEMLEKAMADGDPIARMENFVNGIQVCHGGSFFMMRQGLFKDQAGNYAVDVHICPVGPDPLGVCKDKPFIDRKVRRLPAEKAEAWLTQGVTIPLQMMDGSVPCETRWLFAPPRSESAGEVFITGREFDYIGTFNTQECLYQNQGSKKFTLEVTVKAKEPDEFGLQGSDPYYLRVLLPLSEVMADLWVRQTGAPDVAPVMYVRFFRCLFTSLDYRGDFTLPAYRYLH